MESLALDIQATSNTTSISTSDTKSYMVYLKDKQSLYIIEPLIDKDKKIFSLDACSSLVVSKNYLAAILDGKISLYSNTTLELVKILEEYEQVSAVDFSPCEKYLVLIQKPSVTKNLKVVSLEDFQGKFLFHSTTHPNKLWPQISFTSDESVIFLLSKGTLDVYKITEENGEKSLEKYATLNDVVAFDKAEIKDEKLVDTAILVGRVSTDEKSKKKKSLFSFYSITNMSKPIKEVSVSMTDQMRLKVSPNKKYVLIHSISDDTSNKSYYGESTLYFADLLYGSFIKFTLPPGPIHDFEWASNGEFFAICAGHQPSSLYLYSSDGKFLKDVCKGKFNLIRISPDSRIVCVCGFGSLIGDMEFYRLPDYTIIGKTNFYCCVSLAWSIDSKYLLGAVLSPRMKVDNEYRVLTYNGEEKIVEKFNKEIYACQWIANQDTTPYEAFKIEVSAVYLENLKKKKPEVKLTSTLGTITFNKKEKESDTSGSTIPGLGKKKKK